MPDPDDLPQHVGPSPALRAASINAHREDSAAVPVVAVGASAGGLDAFMRMLEAVPEAAGMAFVLIQHLSPDHESMMAELLGARTPMKVMEIIDQTHLERDCVYVNPPGQYVSLSGNVLTLSAQASGRNGRPPFDFFLNSLALERSTRAMCVVLSGTGKDGTKGLKAIKQAGGFVVAQDPEDASADGMPRSAILTGDVDAVLTAAQIPFALMNWNALSFDARRQTRRPAEDAVPDWLHQVVDVILERTGADFRMYKPGTLVRRITRRMSMASVTSTQGADYVKLLLSSPEECEALAADLLINVTRFFRDPQVFEYIENTLLPELVRDHRPDRPIRVWIAGCSSGEEAWSLAILLNEAIEADGRELRLQMLASDLDPDAIATARAGVYPASIAGDVSAARLARFFVPEERGFKVRDELRAQTVFTVQNLLSDPPFAQLDLVSCRNVLIYLGTQAQAKILSLFHFALVPNGVLLLGTSETGGDIAGRFEVVSKSSRVYRRLGRSGSMKPVNQPVAETDQTDPLPFSFEQEPSTDHRFAEVSQRAVARHYNPASVLVTRQGVCLHFLGPIEHYLEVVAGSASLEILSMVPLSHRAVLREAIAAVGPAKPLIQLAGIKVDANGRSTGFQTDVRFVEDEYDELILVTFQPTNEVTLAAPADPPPSNEGARQNLRLVEMSGISQELEHTTRLLERALETERKIRRESLRLNEEYQSTNEELVTSKEELQSLNEELTVLNSQLQEALERQRTTSDDLKNVLYSTNVATLFLDPNLRIRFFTPATKTVFGVIAADIGRPLADLRPLAIDHNLIEDAGAVIRSAELIEREVSTPDGAWFLRRVMPYRSHSDTIDGVVITYVDVREQHNATEALKLAIRQAEFAIIAKTRFLASASHDLRQPLQTLTFVHSLLARDAVKAEGQHLMDRMEQAVSAMSGMLNTMLDINQIEAGVLSFELEDVPVSEIVDNLYTEYIYHAQAKNIALRLVPSSAVIRTDRRLLQQMVRNLLSNAIRYTDVGCVLIGCRRRQGKLRIEIWDTGIGISEDELPNVFGEYHKIVSRGRTTSEGMGLGLSIVQRLADLLGHRILVRSTPGHGSMFSIEVPLAEPSEALPSTQKSIVSSGVPLRPLLQSPSILIAEDDPDLRQLLAILLEASGHTVAAAADLEAALTLAVNNGRPPELLIADYNLPNGHNGLELARLLRQSGAPDLEVIILTGDISATTQGQISQEGCRQLNKPVGPNELEAEIQQALVRARRERKDTPSETKEDTTRAQVIIVDDDRNFSDAVAGLLHAEGFRTKCFSSGEEFLATSMDLNRSPEPICILIDAYLGGISGFDVLEALHRSGSPAAAIMVTGRSDVQMAVKAMKAGALDFIEKPIDVPTLRLAIEHALEIGRDAATTSAQKSDASKTIEKLTAREREVLDRILLGQPNKNIAADLGISQRTVESHRASVMLKTGCKTLPALVRLAVRAS